MTTASVINEFLGHVEGLTNEAYHSSPGISSSGLIKLLKTTPAHYRAYLNERVEPTEAMELGTAVHTAILEPALFRETYIQKPEGMSFATKDGKSWREDHGHLKIISFENFEMITNLQMKVMGHPILGPILARGKKEQSYFWRDYETNLLLKCRPDCLYGNKVIDIKTAEEAHPRAFQASIAKYLYHVQSAFYLEGMTHVTGESHTDFVHVVLEKKPPYAIACYVLDDASLERAQLEVRRGLRLLKECSDSGVWPAYPEELQTANLPHFMWGDES